jgi:hypothetical protein
MANAAFSALVSQASISMINNRGNIGKVLQELGTVETAKNLAIAMASAGAFAEVGTLTDFHGVDLNKALNNPLDYAANVAGHAAVGCAVGAASGGSCGTGAASAAVSAAATPVYAGSGLEAGTALSATIGGATSAITGGNVAQGALTAAYGYMFNSALGQFMQMDPSSRSAYGEGTSAFKELSDFLKENLGVTFFAGATGETTIGMGASAMGGGYLDTKGSIGLFISSSDTTGFNIGRGYNVGFQFGTAGNTFVGSGYYSYNASTPIGGASLLLDMNTGMFSGLSLNPPGKLGLSGGPTRTCILGQPRTGC